MRFDSYLHFRGNCAEAFRFYEQLFGGTGLFMMTWGESPMADQAPDRKDQIMHAHMMVGSNHLMGADAGPMYRKPEGFRVAIEVDSDAEAERLFAALREGGEVFMDLAETFWAHRFGLLTDRFGIPWMINHSRPMPAQ